MILILHRKNIWCGELSNVPRAPRLLSGGLITQKILKCGANLRLDSKANGKIRDPWALSDAD